MTAAFLVMGFGSIAGAVAMAIRSEYVPALMLGAFGIASSSWLVGEYWPYRGQQVQLGHVTVRGVSQAALVVPVRATKSRGAVVAQSAMGVVCLAIAAFPGPLRLDATLLVRLFWLAMAGILAVGVRNGIRRWRRERFFLAFTPSGIVEEASTGQALCHGTRLNPCIPPRCMDSLSSASSSVIRLPLSSAEERTCSAIWRNR